ncbi:hypothetical protein ACXPVS_13515 [Pseudomonas sp. Ma2-10]
MSDQVAFIVYLRAKPERFARRMNSCSRSDWPASVALSFWM